MQAARVRTQAEQGCTIIDLHGEIDFHTAPEVREWLRDLVARGESHLVLTLDGVEFLDSTGLGALVSGLKRVRTIGGSLHLVCGSERVLTIFRITGLDQVFDIHPDLPGALKAAVGAAGAPVA